MKKQALKRNSVYTGDCVQVLKRFPGNFISGILTDPPYGLSKEPDMREVLQHWLDGDDYEHTSTGFMGKKWDSFVPGPKTWEAVMRVMKPGAHLLSFSGCRTYDLMLTAMRLAGVEVRDKIDMYVDQSSYFSHCYGSGFPKSRSVWKSDIRPAIEKELRKQGVEEDIIWK